MSKRRIAVLIAGMLVCAPIGIASVTGFAPPAMFRVVARLAAEAAEPAATEQAETQQPPTEQQQTAAEQQPAASDAGYVVPARPRTLADATFPPLTSDVFPPSTDERPIPPAVAAYFDRKAANTLLADAGSRDPVFAADLEEGWRMSPMQVAYFDEIEAGRIALAEYRMQAEREASAQASAAPQTSQPETAAETPVDRVAGNVRQ